MDTSIRAFELPIHRVETPGEDNKAGWKLIRECWQQATMLANWGVDQLRRIDCVRDPSMEKWKDVPGLTDEPALYSLFTGLATQKRGTGGKRKRIGPGYPGSEFFDGEKRAVASIFNAVRKKYASERYAVIWLRSKAFSSYRYPHPWPVHAQSVQDMGFSDGKPWVKIALPGGSVVIRLRGGPEFGRQINHFRQMMSAMEAWKTMPRDKRPSSPPCKQMVIRQQGASRSCHRPTVQDRGRACRVMLKMVAEIPVRENKGGRTLVLLTDPQAFWVAELDGRRSWTLNADHVRRMCAAHADHLRTLQRMGEDRKAELRLTGKRRAKTRKRLEALCDKHHDRMTSLTHEMAAHLVGFCERQGVSEIFYLDRDKGFIPKFPWHALKSKLADKTKVAGITLYSESDAKVEVDPSESVAGEVPTVDIKPTTPEEDSVWARVTRLREMATRKVAAARRRSGSHPAVSTP